MMIKKMKLKPFGRILINAARYRWNENENYIKIWHSGGGEAPQVLTKSYLLSKTGNNNGCLGLVKYMRKYFNTVVDIKPKRFRNGNINPHVCTVLGKKGQVLFDAFDEWFEPEVYGVARERERFQGPKNRRFPIDITRQSWDQLFEV